MVNDKFPKIQSSKTIKDELKADNSQNQYLNFSKEEFFTFFYLLDQDYRLCYENIKKLLESKDTKNKENLITNLIKYIENNDIDIKNVKFGEEEDTGELVKEQHEELNEEGDSISSQNEYLEKNKEIEKQKDSNKIGENLEKIGENRNKKEYNLDTDKENRNKKEDNLDADKKNESSEYDEKAKNINYRSNKIKDDELETFADSPDDPDPDDTNHSTTEDIFSNNDTFNHFHEHFWGDTDSILDTSFSNSADLLDLHKTPSIQEEIDQKVSIGPESWSTIIENFAKKQLLGEFTDFDNLSPPTGTPFYLFPFHGRYSQNFMNGNPYSKPNGMAITYAEGENPFQTMPANPKLKGKQTFKIQLL